jgi:hypothetical protein
MRSGESEPDVDFLEAMLDLFDIDEESDPVWPGKEVTVGLPKDYDKAWLEQTPVVPTKKRIPKHKSLVHKTFKRKAEERWQ